MVASIRSCFPKQYCHGGLSCLKSDESKVLLSSFLINKLYMHVHVYHKLTEINCYQFVLLPSYLIQMLQGRVRVLALLVKLFSISNSVASVIHNSGLLNLLETEVHNTNDTLVTLSVLELLYEVG